MSENKRYRWHAIYDRIKDIPSPIGAEIGVHRGECSAHLLEMHPGLKLYMIDMWSPDTYAGKGDDAVTEPYRKIYQELAEENRKKAIEAVEKYGDRVTMYGMDSIEATELFPDEMLDFVFIDASHAYEDVKSDIIAWLPKVKKGGWMIFHDFDNPSFPGVRQAVEEVFSCDVSDWDLPFNISKILGIEIDSDYMAVVRV